MPGRGVLLDTCALIWLANASPILASAVAAIRAPAAEGAVHVSPISAWEIACLARQRTGRPLPFLPDPKAWFAAALRGPGIRPAPFTSDIAIDTEFLPGEPHRDPADCALIAAAGCCLVSRFTPPGACAFRRSALGQPLVTRDTRVLACARTGHVEAMPC